MTGSVSSSFPGARRWRRSSAARCAASWRLEGTWSGVLPGNGGSGYEHRAVSRPIAPPRRPGSRRLAVRDWAGRKVNRLIGVAMNATKILWVQVLVVCAAVLGFVWGATEWTAWRLAFQPQLGEPWFTLFGWPVYQPPPSSGGGSPTSPTPMTSSSPGASSPAPAASRPSQSRSPCRCGAHARSRG